MVSLVGEDGVLAQAISMIRIYPISSLAALAVAIILFWSWSRSPKTKLPLPPGNLGLPLLRENIPFFVSLTKHNGYRDFWHARASAYGPCFKTHVLGSPTVVMDSPEGNKFLLHNEGKSAENEWPKAVLKLLGENSLAVVVGERHRIARRHFASFIDHSAVLGWVRSLDLDANHHFDRHWEGKDELAALEMTRTFTFATICNLLISLPEDSALSELRVQFELWTAGMLSLPINLPGFALYGAFKARKVILEMLDGCIARRRRELGKDSSTRKDMLSALLTTPDQKGRFLSDEEIKDNLLLLLFAGYDTSSATLGMIIHLIAMHPHVYDRLVEEHDSIVESKRASGADEALRHEDIAAMKYTLQVVHEALRVRSPVAGGYRKVSTELQYKGYVIPKGWKLMWNNQLSHFNPNFFPDPYTFNPSRWEQQQPPPAPFTFLPFGLGQRTCPGNEFAKMEMLVFVHHLVKRFRWSLVDPDEPVIQNPFPRTRKNIPIRITSRNRAMN